MTRRVFGPDVRLVSHRAPEPWPPAAEEPWPCDPLVFLAAARGYPLVPLRRGLTILGTAFAWASFAATATPFDRADARAYVAHLPLAVPPGDGGRTPSSGAAIDPYATARTQQEVTGRPTGPRTSVAARTVFVSSTAQTFARCGGHVWFRSDGADDQCAACTPDNGRGAAHHPGGEGSR